jgi:hypothetical protein
MMPLQQQEVRAHGNRQDFIVSSIMMLLADQTVEMLHWKHASFASLSVLVVVLATWTLTIYIYISGDFQQLYRLLLL